jgi:hypothetical protein
MTVNPNLATIMRVIDTNQHNIMEGEYLEAMNALRDLHHVVPQPQQQQQQQQPQQPQQQQPMHLSIYLSRANQYIESSRVRELSVSDRDVHANLWPAFQQLVAITGAADGWKYEPSFKYALDCVKCEYRLTTNSCILENEVIQRRLGFYFIMHLYH